MNIMVHHWLHEPKHFIEKKSIKIEWDIQIHEVLQWRPKSENSPSLIRNLNHIRYMSKPLELDKSHSNKNVVYKKLITYERCKKNYNFTTHMRTS